MCLLRKRSKTYGLLGKSLLISNSKKSEYAKNNTGIIPRIIFLEV